MITKEQLKAIMPHASTANVDKYHAPLNDAMERFAINTPVRQVMFLAQLAHESGCLKYSQEIASGAAYEGRKDLGNDQPGDGVKYKGRGPIQITGKANYRELSKVLGVDFLAKPELLEGPIYGAFAAGWFWSTRGLNELADAGNFLKITKRINGGTNGWADRVKYYNVGARFFGLKEIDLNQK